MAMSLWASPNMSQHSETTYDQDSYAMNSTNYPDQWDNFTGTSVNWTGSFMTPVSGGTVAPLGDDDDIYPLYPTIKQPVHMIVIYSIAYSVIFLLGIIGNSLVVSVVYRNNRMHTVTNYFIVNLAIADILVCLFCLPITLLSNLYTGEFTQSIITYMCILQIYLYNTFICISNILLTVML